MKCKKIIVILLSLALVLSLIPFVSQEAQAASVFVSGTMGTVTYSLTRDGVLTIGGYGEIPDFGTAQLPWPSWDPDYDGEVTTPEVKEIIVSKGITRIGARSFSYESQLTRVSLPEGLKSIGDLAFAGCKSLESITIPSSVTSIGNSVFSSCESLTGITIPDSVKSIGISVFSACKSMTTIKLSSNIKRLGSNMFYGCSSLKSITIPKSVTFVDGSAFSHCDSLGSISVESGSQYYTSLNGVLYNYDKTQLIKYPRQKTDDSYTVLDGVTRIIHNAFYGCTSLKSIVLPDTLKWVEGYAFYDTTSLTDVYYTGTQEQWDNISISGDNGTSNSHLVRATRHVDFEPLTITSNPKAVTTVEGEKASFSVSAKVSSITGGSLSYQWQSSTDNGSTWKDCSSSGYNKATLTFTASKALNNRQYRCVVKSIAGSKISKAVKLTVISAPSITTQPKSASVTLGTTATFTVAASGGGLSYQWQYSKNGGTTWVNWSGKTTASLAVKASNTNNGCLYRCRVTNSAGSVTSSSAKLTITNVKPTITTQPASVKVNAGTKVTFKVAAAGSGLKYQWQFSDDGTTWKNCKSTGYNTASFSFNASAGLNNRQYRCVVSNAYGSTTSDAGKLTVVTKPVITSQPKAASVTAGTKVSFSVTAEGPGLKYQWQYSDDGTTWKNCKSTGYNTATFSFTASTSLNGRQYRCVVSNAYGSTTSGAGKLTVK